MKKLAILMALVICLSFALFVACTDLENTQQTDTSTDSAVDTTTESSTEAPDTDDNTVDTEDTDDGTVDTDDEEVEVGEIDSSKDAYADDLYNGTTPEVIG